ncbi:MAG: hypothetical protein EBS81_04030 [Gammaproteobacteria bacterium]|jgi:hypothetical protein|nr:hypothetical protein [Gammaproteobacteria bacterium]
MDYETYAPLASWFEATWMGEQMRNIFWLFPAMETVHFIGLTIMFGSLLVIDVRVIGFGRFINMRAALKFIPVAIAAFTVNLLSGIAFLCADPFRYFPNIAFQWKMGLIVIAGLNALWFWFGEHKELQQLADGEDAEFRAKVIAALSIAIWVVVIVFGRMIPYVEY